METGVIPVICEITDVAGNGCIEDGDFFTIRSNSTDFDPAALSKLTILYDVTADPMWTGEFHDGVLVQPSEFPWVLIGLTGVAIAAAIVVLLLVRIRKRS